MAATVSNGRNICLSWKTTDGDQTGKYMVYKGYSPGFEISEHTLLAETTSTSYRDMDLDPYKHYFYRVVPVHTNGEVFFGSGEARGETFVPGKMPVVKVTGTNSATIKKYEKFEVNLDLAYVGIENPYDPRDIDVYAQFTTPSGKQIRINGFYDNYRNADQWKVRFSPGETGEYTYQVFVEDAGGTGESAAASFLQLNRNITDGSDHRG